MQIYLISIKQVNNIKNEHLLLFKKKNFLNEKKLLEHCLAYYFLDKILKDIYNIENREIEFVNKKPYLKTREKLFSISHSSNFLVLAISDFECGVDIEEIKERNFATISKRMGFFCDNLDDFYKEWTNFEACYKLGCIAQSFYTQKSENYMLTAVSVNKEEMFEIII